METITHREMRNNSSEVLRRVADGEALLVTNNGVDVAIIGPASATELDRMAARGHVRPARHGIDTLTSIARRHADLPSAEILRDARGPW